MPTDVHMQSDDDRNEMEELPFLKNNSAKQSLSIKLKVTKRAPTNTEAPQYEESSALVEKTTGRKKKRK